MCMHEARSLFHTDQTTLIHTHASLSSDHTIKANELNEIKWMTDQQDKKKKNNKQKRYYYFLRCIKVSWAEARKNLIAAAAPEIQYHCMIVNIIHTKPIS